MIKNIKRIIEIIVTLLFIICNNVFALTPSDLKDKQYEVICKIPDDTYNIFEDWRFWVGISIIIIIIVYLIIHFKKKKRGKNNEDGQVKIID